MNMRLFYYIGLALIGLCFVAHSAHAHHKWYTIQTPTKTAPKVYGGYTTGCVDGAEMLPDQGVGYIKVRKERKKQYGHPNLIRYIEQLGQEAASHNLGNLLISDLAQVRGGFPNPGSSHKSHTSGLDVDIWFARTYSNNLLEPEIQALMPDDLISKDRKSLDETTWSMQHDTVLQLAALQPNVERIFVHPFIKQRLCQNYSGNEWMGKIRAWWGHSSHFHVRLACPADSTECTPQKSVPAGDGCGSDYINHWVKLVTPGKKNISSGKKKTTKKKTKPKLHPECEHVYTR